MAPLDAPNPAPLPAVEAFIARWQDANGAERANCQSFLIELCHLLGVPPPDPANGGAGGDYRFERSVWRDAVDAPGRKGWMDLYKRDSFIFEGKQGASPPRQATLFGDENQHRSNVRRSKGWAQGMMDAKGQAEGYARGLVRQREVPPPFLIVCDVGFCFDLYADFSGTGLHYAQFPDREGFRIHLTDLRDPELQRRLRRVWTNAASLNPALERQRVTQNIAQYLAKLARALEGTKDKPRHTPKEVSAFLTRCIFCMFAQSVGLLPEGGTFTALLQECETAPGTFVDLVGDLWARMNTGGFYAVGRAFVLRFNGGLFVADDGTPAKPLPLDATGIKLLLVAAQRDWRDVEPAIFGTLLEQALDTATRGQLGAEFTPRAFVERLVLPTVMEPLRLEWDAVKAVAREASEGGRPLVAAAAVRAFHSALCKVVVLDPACGTGNFLYVTLELMKRLEGEVLDALAGLEGGEVRLLDLGGVTVGPRQFHGLDLNPRAVPVAVLVLWIGYLQWHFRTQGKAPPAEPILHQLPNIRCADALLEYDGTEPALDAKGSPRMEWGGRETLHLITGDTVPDGTDQVAIMRPVNPKVRAWPKADFIVGNPPFVAGKDLRTELGSGYAEALWRVYPKVPASADLALHFWWKAAGLAAVGEVRRFGLITSNSLRQVFCRQVVQAALCGPKPLHLLFAIPDHPWAQGADAAAVRIAMTVAEAGTGPGRLMTVMREDVAEVPAVEFVEHIGIINADLTVGISPAEARALRANAGVCSPGVKLHGAGFIVTPARARALGLGRVPGLEAHIRPYLNGKDMTGRSRGLMVIDLFGLTENEVQERFPAVYDQVLLRVKPERDHNPRRAYRDAWWVFGEPRRDLRPALHGLPRYIATVETAKHRLFTFQPATVLPDNKLLCIATDDAFHLGVLSSSLHGRWALAAGGWLGFGNDPVYVKTRCFDPFPFPAATLGQAKEIGRLAEALDRHRAARLAEHSFITLTGLYNLADAVRAGRALTEAERDGVEAGQVATLLHLHGQLDTAVAAAYGWPANLPAVDVVARVVALNRDRCAAEARGEVQWLRPAFQAPATLRLRGAQAAMDVGQGYAALPWPKHAPAQYIALRTVLTRGAAGRPAELAELFIKAPGPARLRTMLDTLAALGQARKADGGTYAA